MSNKYVKSVYIKRSKEKNKKIGVKSIHEIINNTPELNLKQKVDYIRHHYAYYDGNYDYFYLSNGIPTPRLHQLNVLIYNIIKKQADPYELTLFNNKVIEWRKRRNKKLELAVKFKKENSNINKETAPAWKLELLTKTMINEESLNNVYNFLNSKNNKLSKEKLNTISYKDLCILAKKWIKKEQNKNVL